MNTIKIEGQLEIDTTRGVIYFHCSDERDAMRLGTATPLRLCNLPAPIPASEALDVTHMVGCSWDAAHPLGDVEHPRGREGNKDAEPN